MHIGRKLNLKHSAYYMYGDELDIIREETREGFLGNVLIFRVRGPYLSFGIL